MEHTLGCEELLFRSGDVVWFEPGERLWRSQTIQPYRRNSRERLDRLSRRMFEQGRNTPFIGTASDYC